MHHVNQHECRFVKKITNPELRFFNDLDGPKFERRNCVFGTAVSDFRADHNWHRPFFHDFSQEGKAIHARHHQVSDDNVGRFLFDFGPGNNGVGGDADLNFRVRLENALHDLTDDGRVVNHEHADASVEAFRFVPREDHRIAQL